MTLIDAAPPARRVLGRAIEVRRTLGPGLIEPAYEACRCQEHALPGIAIVNQQKLPVVYKGHRRHCDLRMDVIVEQSLIPEIKSARVLHPVHEAQLHTYLKLGGLRVGLPMNFSEVRLIDDIRRRLH